MPLRCRAELLLAELYGYSEHGLGITPLGSAALQHVVQRATYPSGLPLCLHAGYPRRCSRRAIRPNGAARAKFVPRFTPDCVKDRPRATDRGGGRSLGCRKGVPVTTVLICDDRRSVREGLTRVMAAVPGGSRIDCGAHGDELLARFSRQPVDVVLVGTQ